MIIRIVKMTFDPEKVAEFQSLFNESKELIRGFNGVEKLDLYRDKNSNNIFFTYSVWRNEDYLEEYRKSELFQKVWGETKKLFSEKPQAWSVDKIVGL